MLLPLPTPEEMSQWDTTTIEHFGIPGVTLMESASREAVNVLLHEYGSVKDIEIYCFAGSGNNGGDAFAMARHLVDLGADVTVFHTQPQKAYRGEARSNLRWAQQLGINFQHLASTNIQILNQPDVIIDGLLGTGFQGELRDQTVDIITTINQLSEKAFVLAIDIPSGLNGLTGKAQPIAVKADATVTFQAAKLGLTMPGASQYTGIVDVRPIGIPRQIQKQHPTEHCLISRDVMELYPSLSSDMHKGNGGKVLVIGGSEGLTGAPHLSALGALRSGSGLVTIASPEDLTSCTKCNSPDIMTLSLGKGAQWTTEMATAVSKLVDQFDAFVIGPGLGRDIKTVDFVTSFVANCPARVIVDADALYCLSEDLTLLSRLPDSTILTPHPGEMARLLKLSNHDVQAKRSEAVDELTNLFSGTVILKGAGTIVADKTVKCISPFAEPNLAIGGSGDVLSGIIASLLGRDLPPLEAACLAVYWHGLTGRTLRKTFPSRGNLASDIANTLPMAAKEFFTC